MPRQNENPISKTVKKLLQAEQKVAESLDELSQIEEKVVSGAIPALPSAENDRDRWDALSESTRKNFIQAIMGARTLEIHWNDRHTRAEVCVDGEKYPEQPRMLVLLLQALCAKTGESGDWKVGWKEVAGLQEFIAASAPRGRKAHSITQLLHRLRKLIPNQMLLEREENPTRYRFAIRQDAQVTVR